MEAADAAMLASQGEISADDPRASDVRKLLERHLAFAHSQTPSEEVHALDSDGLVDPAITFFSFRANGMLLGIGALKELDRQHAELKSMHTAETARGAGIGRAMLDHILRVARERDFLRVSLETGTTPAFVPARALYADAGFRPCPPFGNHRPSRYKTFMTLALNSPPLQR
jgi:putative acetyltransferase